MSAVFGRTGIVMIKITRVVAVDYEVGSLLLLLYISIYTTHEFLSLSVAPDQS